MKDQVHKGPVLPHPFQGRINRPLSIEPLILSLFWIDFVSSKFRSFRIGQQRDCQINDLLQIFLLNVVCRLMEASRLFVMSGVTMLEQPEACQDSADCPLDFCCQGLHSNIVDPSGTFDVVGKTYSYILYDIYLNMYMLDCKAEIKQL